ncbi:MAG: DNA polymerase III subunit delta, partial [Methylovirgula sp.]
MVAVKASEVERFLKRPPAKIVVYLLFGADAGLVAERAQKVVARNIDDLKDPFQFLRLSGDDLAADPLRLADEANT